MKTYLRKHLSALTSVALASFLIGAMLLVSDSAVAQRFIRGAYQAGSILFANAQGLFLEDNANFFYDGTNHRLGLSTKTPSSILGLGGAVARLIGMERHTTANTAGNNLTISAGGATSAATNKNGGSAVIAGGISTGTGTSTVVLKVSPAGSSGTADNALSTAATLDPQHFNFSVGLAPAQTVNAAASGGVTFDASTGDSFALTITGTTTLTVSNTVAGQRIMSLVCQDGSGSHTFNWPSNFKGATAIPSTASKCSGQQFLCDGTNCWATGAATTGM